jgi:hypothetical protein
MNSLNGGYKMDEGRDTIRGGEMGRTLFDVESIDQLSPEKKSDYIQLAIKNCLSKHPEGLTVQLLAEYTGLAQKTVKKHLDQLTATREAFKKEYGARVAIFFPNGKQVLPNAPKVLTIGDGIFQLQVIENSWGKFIYIQERKKEVHSNMVKTVGGIMIDCEGIPELIDALKEIILGCGVSEELCR